MSYHDLHPSSARQPAHATVPLIDWLSYAHVAVVPTEHGRIGFGARTATPIGLRNDEAMTPRGYRALHDHPWSTGSADDCSSRAPLSTSAGRHRSGGSSICSMTRTRARSNLQRHRGLRRRGGDRLRSRICQRCFDALCQTTFVHIVQTIRFTAHLQTIRLTASTACCGLPAIHVR